MWGELKLSGEFLAGVGVSVFSILLGDWDTPLRILLVLMAVDVISGCIKGWCHGQFTSRAFRQGLATKAGFFLVLIVAYQIDLLMENSEPFVRVTVTTAYIIVEATSLLENLAQIGVPIPSILTERLGALTQNKKSADDVKKQQKNEKTE